MTAKPKRNDRVKQRDKDDLMQGFLELSIDRRIAKLDLINSVQLKTWKAKVDEIISGDIERDYLMNRVHLFIPRRSVALYCYAVLWNEALNRTTYYLAADPQGQTPFARGWGHQFGDEARLSFNRELQAAVNESRGNERKDKAVAGRDRHSAAPYDPSLPVLKEVERGGVKLLDLTENARAYWDDRPPAPMAADRTNLSTTNKATVNGKAKSSNKLD